jgi:hypothetical protein
MTDNYDHPQVKDAIAEGSFVLLLERQGIVSLLSGSSAGNGVEVQVLFRAK